MRLFVLLLTTLAVFVNHALAQPCAGQPGRSAQTAFSVCGTLTFHETNLNNCSGPGVATTSCGPATSNSSAWYKFHCYQSGTLGFLITPGSGIDDYDWVLCDYTGRPPGDVYSFDLSVSTNLSALTGSTGCTSAGTGNSNCAGNTPKYNQLANLILGHDYLLMVTNWSSSGTGYDLSFGGGTAVLTDNRVPDISSAGIVNCNASKVKVVFSEDILCNSMTAAGTEFTITPGTNTIASVTSICTTGANSMTEVTLNLQNPLPAGNYTVTVNNGTDGNTLLDVCQTPMVAGTFYDFSVPVSAPPMINAVTYTGCAPNVLKVAMNKVIACNSITPTGSEFDITPAGPVVTSVVSSCNTGATYTDTLYINLQNQLPPGNYVLHVNNGSDGNPLLDTCGTATAAGYSIPFTVSQVGVGPQIQSINIDPCKSDRVILNFDESVLCNSLTAAGSEISISPGAWTVSSITTNCSSGSKVNQVILNLASPLPGGNYNVNINNGTDGNTLADTCLSYTPVGYTKAFSFTSPPAPQIQSVVFDECHPDKLVVNFDKPILCSTMTAAGAELTVTPGSHPVNSITFNCIASSYTSQFVMNMASPLPAGNFFLNVNNGTDGNTLADTCNSFITPGYNVPFTTTQAPKPRFDSLQFDKCSPATIKVFYNHAIACNSVSADGSEFSITGPSTVNITGATMDVSCVAGYTNWINLQLAAPITVNGNYVLHNQTGTDGNGMIDTCSATQSAAEIFNFSILGNPSAAFNYTVNWGCSMDTVLLSQPGGNGVNSWTWNFSDGSTASGQNVSVVFPINTPSVDVQLTVSNGVCSDVSTQTVTLGNVINASFINTSADSACINTPFSFSNTSTGNIVNYLWDFGDLSQFNGANPPPHVYTNANNYNVQLFATDNHGCKDTAQANVVVTQTAMIDILGLASQYCTNQEMTLRRKISRNITTYTWDNGDGKTFVDRTFVQFSYPNPGVYTITLTGMDRYCGVSTVSKTVPVYQLPTVNLGPDTILCPGEKLLLGPPAQGYNYSWNTGAATSQILSSPFSRNYMITVDNNGCKAIDDIYIKILNACLIRVPNAFTPNRDGTNDLLMALNADLVKDLKFSVFNRFGQQVFHTTSPLTGWDGSYKGQPCESGAYVWMLDYTDPWTGKPVHEKGTSILLR